MTFKDIFPQPKWFSTCGIPVTMVTDVTDGARDFFNRWRLGELCILLLQSFNDNLLAVTVTNTQQGNNRQLSGVKVTNAP